MKEFLARIAYCSFSSAAVVCQDSALLLQRCLLDVGGPATAHLPPSCVQQDTECFFQGCRKPVDWLCLGGQGHHIHNIASYMLLATRKGRSEKGLGPDKVSLWE